MKISVYAILLGTIFAAVPASAQVEDKSDDIVAPEVAEVFTALQGDIFRCLKGARGKAYITVEAAVKNDGTVTSVKTTGGALAGSAAMQCVERRVMRATFPRLRGKGPSLVKAAFELDV